MSDFERIPAYPPLFARGPLARAPDPVVVVGYEFLPNSWGAVERGLVKVRSSDGTIRSVPPKDFRQWTLDEREVNPGMGFEWEAHFRARSEADTIAAARALLAPMAEHPVHDIALELIACPLVAWSKTFPETPMGWCVSSGEEEEGKDPTLYFQLRLEASEVHNHKLLLLLWASEQEDGWTLAERAHGTMAHPYVGDLSTFDRALACLVDGSHA